MNYTIENESVKAVICSKGCELISFVKKDNKREYMWCADPSAWKRHSPILFPVVGKYKNNESIYDNKKYRMSQHGFARDMEFTLVKKETNSIFMELKDNGVTHEKYPFSFRLVCGYILSGNSVKVVWKVENKDERKMYFSIGGHPAFAAPESKNNCIGCELKFEGCSELQYNLLSEDGQYMDSKYVMPLNSGRFEIREDTFEKDALIVENNQCHKVSLMSDGKPLVTLTFDSPLFGIWSPAGTGVPFVCIEPWYGRTDGENFNGRLEERTWGNVLAPGAVFEKSYEIELG